jgi:3,4-dihydroxy 2-butanone 4-phosphate synthase/GTP cyclohydrolase II
MLSIMTSAADMIASLRTWVLDCGLPRKRIAREAGLAPSALWSADSENWNPTADTIRKLDALRCRLAASNRAA